jgi:methylenetetrahydrofolate dehydrogenase (NADP+)/methenyltetrahydrofolate cyclohydrolase
VPVSCIDSQHHQLGSDASPDDTVQLVQRLSSDEGVDGILVQHPTAPQVDERLVFEAIGPAKAVDGVTGASFAAMALGGKGFASGTPGGIMRLLDAYAVDIAGRRAVVVGRSLILRKPVGMLLLARDATVTYCHSRTVDLPAVVAEQTSSSPRLVVPS